MDQLPWSTGMLVLLMEPEPQILDLMEPVQFIHEEPGIIWTCFFSWDKESQRQTGSCQLMQEVLILWSPSGGSGWKWRWTRNQDLLMMHLTGSDINDCLMINFYLMFYNKYNRYEFTLMYPYCLYGINYITNKPDLWIIIKQEVFIEASSTNRQDGSGY